MRSKSDFKQVLEEVGDYLVSPIPDEIPEGFEADIFCPIHEDPASSKSASARWRPIANSKKQKWRLGLVHCFNPDCELNEVDPPITSMVAILKMLRSDSVSNIINLDDHRDGGQPVTENSLEAYRELLRDDQEHQAWAQDHLGLEWPTLDAFQWGWHPARGCFIFPVRDRYGVLVGFRLYDPFHLDKPKKRWYMKDDGPNQNQLYGIGLSGEASDAVILMEGETDTMAAWQDGFTNAISHTGGAGTWRTEWNWYFRGKTAYICYDSDEAGRRGAAKVAAALKEVATAIYAVALPTGMDYRDFREAGHSVEDFEEAMAEADELWRQADDALPLHGNKSLASVSEIRDLTAEDLVDVKAYISGKTDTVYSIPRKMELSCGQDQGDKCKSCPLMAVPAGEPMPFPELRPDKDETLVSMMGAKDSDRKKAIRERYALHCNSFEVEELEPWYVETVQGQDPVDSSTPHSIDSTFPIHHFYDSTEPKMAVGEDYRITGLKRSDPRNSHLIFTAWRSEHIGNNIDNYTLTSEGRERLEVFQPEDLDSITSHLHAKYQDLSTNITRIRRRADVHLMTDLVIHSAIAFPYDGMMMEKGWLDNIIIGDTRTGKTQVVSKLIEHYRAGYLASGENTSYAGLVGGSSEMVGSNQRIVLWGILPRHNGRFVAIDEAAGMRDVLGQMSSVRTSGIAEVNKQGGGRTAARVRLLWLTNPRADHRGYAKMIADIRGGAVRALSDVAGSPEDVARFDAAMTVVESDIPSGALSKKWPVVDHIYLQDVCTEMVMFAWSRKTHNIRFAKGVEDYVKQQALRITRKYVPVPPLVQESNFDKKVARMAVALAMMTYSVDATGENVVVHHEHVDYVIATYDRWYSHEYFGYETLSRQQRARTHLADSSTQDVYDYFSGTLDVSGLPNGKKILTILAGYDTDYIDESALSRAMGMQGDAGDVMQWLLERGMVRRTSRYTDFTPELIAIIRELSDEALMEE